MKAILSSVDTAIKIGLRLYQAMVFMFMFNWFVSEQFGMSEISYWLSYALILTVSIVRMKSVHLGLWHYEKNEVDDEERLAFQYGSSLGIFMVMNLLWFIGWIIQLNIG